MDPPAEYRSNSERRWLISMCFINHLHYYSYTDFIRLMYFASTKVSKLSGLKQNNEMGYSSCKGSAKIRDVPDQQALNRRGL